MKCQVFGYLKYFLLCKQVSIIGFLIFSWNNDDEWLKYSLFFHEIISFLKDSINMPFFRLLVYSCLFFHLISLILLLSVDECIIFVNPTSCRSTHEFNSKSWLVLAQYTDWSAALTKTPNRIVSVIFHGQTKQLQFGYVYRLIF